MTRLGMLLTAMLCAAMALGACSQRSAGEKRDAGKTAARAAGQRAEAAQKADAGQQPDIDLPPGLLDPDAAGNKVRDPIRYASQVEALARKVDPQKAPDYAKKMVVHMREIAELMGKNLEDCDAVVAELKAYIDQNRKELEALHKEGEAADKGMSPEQRAQVQAQTLLLMSPFAEQLARTEARFAIQCKDQAHQVAELMQAVSGD